MIECVECGQQFEGFDVVEHHTNYETDQTVPACRACHQKIHADKGHPLYPEGNPSTTSIRLSEELTDYLYERKRRGESYEDVIWRTLGEADDDAGVGDACGYLTRALEHHEWSMVEDAAAELGCDDE